ncbi:Chloride Channel (ClC) Family [Thraustotheca clavata]|uniref:Chloride channel protein n=1 Tax=Thraustotheca clavata TaxID=74557 RepID=A0A1W0ACE6_9STRA|nr:Chloride Channel (ClC) Family [Thraustotheca clavata]
MQRCAAKEEMESLDYDMFESIVNKSGFGYKYRDGREKNRSIVVRWILTLVAGLITALAGIILLLCTQTLAHVKRTLIEHYITAGPPTLVFGVLMGFNVVLVLIATSLTIFGEPVAAGSGISEIKSMLNGVKIPRMLRFRTLCCKLLGTICAVSGGLPVGKEGPMIHSGSIIAAGISQGKSSTWGYDTSFTYFAGFRNDREKRDFLSCGAAAGVAAAFGSPIGGVLFVLEEGASFWNQTLTWRTLFCAMVSTFTLAFFISGMSETAGHSWGTLGSQAGTFTFGPFNLSTYQVWEIPIFILMGVGGGMQGAFFNALNTRLARFRARWIQTKCVWLLEAIIISCSVTVMAFWVSFTFGSCHPAPKGPKDNVISINSWWNWWSKEEPLNDIIPDDEDSYPYRHDLVRFYCPPDYYNDLASLLLAPGETAIRHLFHASPETFDMNNLVLFWVLSLISSCWTYGLKLPSGLFIPALLTGAAYGRLWTRIINAVTSYLHAKTIDPRVYGLIGSAAMLGGVTRMTISLTVILLECTGNIEYGLPLIVTLFSARWVGNYFNHGIYDIHIHLRRIPFLDWDPPVQGSQLRVKHVMTRHPKYLRTVERAGTIYDLLCNTTHNGFPVIVEDPTFGSKFFAGMILRKQLDVLLSRHDFSFTKPTPFSRHPRKSNTTEQGEGFCLSYRDMEANYPHYPHPTSVAAPNGQSYTLNDTEREAWVDLTPYMNQTPFVIQEEAPFTRAYRLFRSSGLRHLIVVNRHNNVRGILTRRELEEDHCARCWRLSRRLKGFDQSSDTIDEEGDTYNYSTKPVWRAPRILKRHIDRADQVRRVLSSMQKPLLSDSTEENEGYDEDEEDAKV